MKRINTFESLNLSAHLEQAYTHMMPLQWVPWVNVLCIGLGLYLFSSDWLCPPGLQVDLPKVSARMAYQTVLPIDDVLILDKEGRIFFHHKLYTLEQLPSLFPKEHNPQTILLLKIDQHVPWGQVSTLIDAARMHGYQHIQVAVDINDENF